jgi:hypothetical protein
MNLLNIRLSVAIAGLIMLAGCATPPPIPANPADQDPTAGTIVFYRPIYTLFGHGHRPNLLIDGLLVGRSVPGESFSAKATPGPHVVSAPSTIYSGVATLDVVVRTGEKIYVRTSMGGPAWAGLANVELIDAKVAEAELVDLDKVKR